MEHEASAPETHAPVLPGAYPSPYPSDSVVDNSIKKSALEVDNKNIDNKISSSTTNGTSNGSDDGFVSGEEEFELAPDKPIEVTDASPADVPESSAPKTEEPVLKAPAHDFVVDDDDKVRALKEGVVVGDEDKGLEGVVSESFVERNGNEDVGSEKKEVRKGGEVDEGKETEVYGDEQYVQAAEVGDVVRETEVLGGRDGKVYSGNSEVENDKLPETESVKFTSEGDAVVEDVNVDVSASGVVVFGDVEGTKETEVKGLDVPVGESVPLDNGFEKIGRDAVAKTDVEPVTGLKTEAVEVDGVVEGPEEMEVKGLDVPVGDSVPLDYGFEKIGRDVEEPVAKTVVEPVTGLRTKAVEVEGDEGETNISSALKDGNSGVSNVVDDAIPKDNGDIPEVEVSVGESGSASMINGGQDIEPESGLAADPETKLADRAVEAAINSLNVVLYDAKDAGGEDRTRELDAANESAQTQAVVEVPEDNETFVGAVRGKLEDEVRDKSDIPESVESNTVTDAVEVEDEEEESEDEGLITDGETEGDIFGSSEAAKQFLEELERESGVSPNSGAESSHEHSQRIDGQIVTDSDDEVDTDEEGEGKELFDSAALAALLKAATGAGSDGGAITVTSQDGSRLFSVERPAGLGSSLRSVKPAARPYRSNLFSNSTLTAGGDTDNNLSEEEKKKLENLQQIRVKFLRLVHRLGQSTEESIAAQVLYRLALVAGRQTNQLFSLEAAKRTALQLETEGKDLDFSLNILVLGKAGVGKSATINSIFGEDKSEIHAFEPATAYVKEITGIVEGVKIRVIDTPGLKPSGSEQGANRKILTSVKKYMKKCPPDIVLYVDRLDTQTRDLNDLPLLRSITSTLGSSIWRNAIVTLTHAASAPPDGPSGSPLSYDVFVAQRSHVVQHSIGQAVGDLRLMNPSLANPVSLVENHRSCRKNREGQRVLPNGQAWRPQLLMICYSIKILSEASSLSKPQEPFDHRKLFGFRVRSPPLPYLLSWLLQSRTHPKLSTDQGGDSVDSDVDLDDLSDSDQEEEEDDEYDQLPPFKPLRKAQLAKLSKEQKKAYIEEYEYRVKLLQKKQWKEELKRMKEVKKKGKVSADEYGYMGEDVDPENGAPAAVPVPLPDMVLPPSFDGDNPAYRYRFLEPTSQFMARPVLDTHGWDHDCGYDGVNVEQSLAIVNQFPAAVTVQITKDKKEFNIHLDSSVSAKHGENGSSMAGFDIQNVGKQLAYIVRGETKFKNFRKNKTAAGFSLTFLGENVATGLKVEDQITLGKRLTLVGTTGTVRSQGDSAYGANLEVRLREADYPIGQDQSSLGLSLVKWRGDLALGANLQSQFSIGRSSKVAVRAGLNNKMSGQITVRTSSSEQLQLALVGLLPIAMSIYKAIRPGVSENYSMY